MNKTQLVDALAARIGDRRTAASAVEGLLETIVDTVRSGETVSLTGFGVFEIRERAARTARNPRTGESVAVPATTVPAFRPGTGFRTAVEGGGTPAPRTTPARRTRAATAPVPDAPPPATRRRVNSVSVADAATPGRRSTKARSNASFAAAAAAPEVAEAGKGKKEKKEKKKAKSEKGDKAKKGKSKK